MFRSVSITFLALCLCQGFAVTAWSADDIDSPSVTEHNVLPILLRRCANCHGATYQEGDLDLRSRASILKGGENGPAIEPGAPDASLLIEKIAGDDMPPEKDRGRAGIEDVTPDELETIRQWIAAGAPETPSIRVESKIGDGERDHWAFHSPKKSATPSVQNNSDRVQNEIDAFLLAKLEAKDLSFSPEADRTTLLRRAAFMLTGLPPSPEAIRQFAADRNPQAYEKAIDEMLASPRYGERWGRIWLDVAGYADSEGKRSADMIRQNAWRYRDYVIRSFNADKPYDQFLIEQLAGDELADWDWESGDDLTQELHDNLVATGFLRMAPDGTTANPVNRVEDRLEVMTDELRVLTEGVMGLTMECARCHDHKYDPLTQRDFYGMLAVFKGAYDENDWMTPQGFSNQWEKSKQRLITRALPEERIAWEAEVATIDTKIEPLKKQIAALDKKATAEKKKLENEIKKLEGLKPKAPMIRALWDRGQPSNTYVMNRGDHMQPGALIGPQVPEVLAIGLAPYQVEAPWDGAKSTGRRLAFARWLTQPEHPLTARVIVNRVWEQHFGTGIVRTLDNFGVLGEPPSHPELLDSLAVAFVENGWSLKWLNREIMTSAAWRQQSKVTEDHARLDPENRLVSRMPLRRLDAEEVRDTVLLISGKLDESPFGKPDPVDVRKDGLVTAKLKDGDASKLRRSVYLRHRRKEMPTILETFDQPAMNPNCIERTNSTIVTQPLHLLNNARIHELAGFFSKRIAIESSGDTAGQIEHAWMLALNRTPSNDEVAAGVEGLKTLTAAWSENLSEEGSKDSAETRALEDFCHTLINSAEFLYLD